MLVLAGVSYGHKMDVRAKGCGGSGCNVIDGARILF